MPVAIDTSVLIAAEKAGDVSRFAAASAETFYIPALAATEFLIGTHPPVREHLRERARRLYENIFRDMVSPFEEADAAQLAALESELRRTGRKMQFYDAAIAATAIARGDSLMVLDSDFDRLEDRLTLIKP
jgi:predicted nucleic acid-binding protein